MKKRYPGGSRFLALVVLAVVAISGTACSRGGGWTSRASTVEKQGFYLNTICNIQLQEWDGDEKAGEALIDQAFLFCGQLEQKLSRTVAGSDVCRINQAGGQPVEIDDPRVTEALKLGMEYSELSGGRFDITIGELAELWNFSAENPSVPEESAIRQAVAHVDYQKFHLEAADGGSAANSGSATAGSGAERWIATLDDPRAKLDLGAVAKGYIVDQVSDFLRENGVVRGIVDFGGNVSCIGEKTTGEPWLISIRKPVSVDEPVMSQSETIGTVQVKADCSAVTSGTYQRCFVQDGVLYHHILDPKTGYPCDSDVKSVTIIGESSGRCDGLSTVCLLLGMEEGMRLMESLPGYEAVFVDMQGRVESTSGAAFEPLSPST